MRIPMNLRSKLVACWVLTLSLLGATAGFAETAPADTAKAAPAAAVAAAPAAPAVTVDSATLARIADLNAVLESPTLIRIEPG